MLNFLLTDVPDQQTTEPTVDEMRFYYRPTLDSTLPIYTARLEIIGIRPRLINPSKIIQQNFCLRSVLHAESTSSTAAKADKLLSTWRRVLDSFKRIWTTNV